MDAFSQKLRAIYNKLFNENIDDFTEALIDHQKFDREKFHLESETEKRKQFLLNRKIVLRRWLRKGTNCTADFQKSYKNYKLSHYLYRGSPLFTLDELKRSDNMEWFHKRLESYLQNQKRAHIQVEYQYLYFFHEESREIYSYEIKEWLKGESDETILEIEHKGRRERGTFNLTDENNIFITLKIDGITNYLLFHDNNDNTSPYIVGMSMGYLPTDNRVPRSKKVIFSKRELEKESLDLTFVLNETETLSAIENRFNLNSQEVKINHFVKYFNRLKDYSDFFKKLRKSYYRDNFYYRLAFQEFYSIKKLFQRVSKEESYYIMDYQRALLELLKTVEEIGNIPLQIVMKLDEENLFLQSTKKDREIQEKFLNLYRNSKVKTELILVHKRAMNPPLSLLKKYAQADINIYTVEEEDIFHEIDSIDFAFIHLNDRRDFVLADPIRDSKNVYKLFINELTMDEYRTDYQKILKKSKPYRL